MSAVLAAAVAHGAQNPAAAKTHRKSVAAASAHTAHRPASSQKTRRARPAQTGARANSHAKKRSAHKPTPDEAGRKAGVAIRRQIQRKQLARRSTARRAGSRGGKTAEPAEPLRAANQKAEAKEASLRIPRGRMPAPLRGSAESLERQNERLDADGLERIEDESDLAARIASKLLVPVPASKTLAVNGDLSENHRYCRPWTAQFLTDLARAHAAAFHRPLMVSSAVRTVEYQKQLRETNGNAAAAEGDVVSPHMTGATVDIAKSGLGRQEIAWMRKRLLALQDAGKIDVEEEFRQACFHITVYKSYAPERTDAPVKPGPQRSGRSKTSGAGSRAAEGL